jgi:hypothetical protein
MYGSTGRYSLASVLNLSYIVPSSIAYLSSTGKKNG